MKRYIRAAIIIVSGLAIALISAAVTITTRAAHGKYMSTAALLLQTTPTTQPQQDESEVGSTDGIVVMGFMIVVIVLVPVLLQYKTWRRIE